MLLYFALVLLLDDTIFGFKAVEIISGCIKQDGKVVHYMLPASSSPFPFPPSLTEYIYNQ